GDLGGFGLLAPGHAVERQARRLGEAVRDDLQPQARVAAVGLGERGADRLQGRERRPRAGPAQRDRAAGGPGGAPAAGAGRARGGGGGRAVGRRATRGSQRAAAPGRTESPATTQSAPATARRKRERRVREPRPPWRELRAHSASSKS